MNSTILLTGGTGTLGSHVVPLLTAAGREVRVLSRRTHKPTDGFEFVTGDLTDGQGIRAAVAGANTIVHLAGTTKGDETKAEHLVRAAKQAGVEHLVYISVVGADRIPVVSGLDRAMFGYFAAKRAAERIVESSGLPWTTVRATQFHDLMLMTARAMAKMPVLPVPSGFRVQPIDVRDVAEQIVELALGQPAGLVPDLAGPRVYDMDELVRSYLRASGKRRLMLRMRVPGKAAAAYRAGANLAPERSVGRRTWEAFLAEQVSRTTREPAREASAEQRQSSAENAS
jgi:uncharacterized protein YbjT (DUF2867 family)